MYMMGRSGAKRVKALSLSLSPTCAHAARRGCCSSMRARNKKDTAGKGRLCVSVRVCKREKEEDDSPPGGAGGALFGVSSAEGVRSLMLSYPGPLRAAARWPPRALGSTAAGLCGEAQKEKNTVIIITRSSVYILHSCCAYRSAEFICRC